MSERATSPHSGGADECDLLVIGSGAAGFAAAVTAAHGGAKVILAEKTEAVGGTSSWSGGWIFAPRNPLARRAGVLEEIDAPRTYLRNVLGNDFRADVVEAFLENAPQMVAFFEEKTALQFESGTHIPDTYGHLEGAGQGGRSVIAAPYDGRGLKDLVKILRKPLRETTFMGMTIQAGPDLKSFMNVTRDAKSFAYVGLRTAKHFRDLAFHGRGMQMRNGLALIARLLRSAADLGVDVRVNAPAERLLIEDGRVVGAVIGGAEVRAKAVVLASGGFPNDPVRRAELFPRVQDHRTLAIPSASGDGARMGEEAGGRVAEDLASPGAWCPVSVVKWPDGSEGLFPHIIERGKPGVIGVLETGKRFCNEGMGYHDYVLAMLANIPEDRPARSWLVCSRAFQRRYGLGVARPAPLPETAFVKSGYLKTGKTIRELAQNCGIDPDGLEATIADWNRNAAQGEDPEFGRGSTPYQRLQGDAAVQPNPCVAPIAEGPFYAVEVIPGSFGTFAGLRTDADARVLGEDGSPIPGLYAAGTDMASVMGGHYPAGGINLGPAMTFGFIAGRHAAAALKEGAAA